MSSRSSHAGRDHRRPFPRRHRESAVDGSSRCRSRGRCSARQVSCRQVCVSSYLFPAWKSHVRRSPDPPPPSNLFSSHARKQYRRRCWRIRRPDSPERRCRRRGCRWSSRWRTGPPRWTSWSGRGPTGRDGRGARCRDERLAGAGFVDQRRGHRLSLSLSLLFRFSRWIFPLRARTNRSVLLLLSSLCTNQSPRRVAWSCHPFPGDVLFTNLDLAFGG